MTILNTSVITHTHTYSVLFFNWIKWLCLQFGAIKLSNKREYPSDIIRPQLLILVKRFRVVPARVSTLGRDADNVL